jgi:hypothetical protein
MASQAKSPAQIYAVPDARTISENLEILTQMGIGTSPAARETPRAVEAQARDQAEAQAEAEDESSTAADFPAGDVAPAPPPPPQPPLYRQKPPSHRRGKTPDPKPPDRARHRRRCAICGAKCQQEIEDAFVSWESVDIIAENYGICRRSVYRHAHAFGLFVRRDRNIRRALGLLSHRADKVRDVSADSIIRAVEIFAHINQRGEWRTPPAHVIVRSDNAGASHCRRAADDRANRHKVPPTHRAISMKTKDGDPC